jgi:hypothetical protein
LLYLFTAGSGVDHAEPASKSLACLPRRPFAAIRTRRPLNARMPV